jgi:hypothetical protein
MEYELLKEMSDRGFIFEVVWREYAAEIIEIDSTEYVMPDLSDLIKACGPDFLKVGRRQLIWLSGRRCQYVRRLVHASGETASKN